MKDFIKIIKYKRTFKSYLDDLFEDVKIKDDYRNPYKTLWWKDSIYIGVLNTHDTFYGFFICTRLIIDIQKLYSVKQHEIVNHVTTILKNKYNIITSVRISD